jgi:hypothetical protein
MKKSFATMRRAAVQTSAAVSATLLCLLALPASGEADPVAAPAIAETGECGQANPGYSRLVLATEGLSGYYRLGETSGPVACDLAGGAHGISSGGYSPGQPGALETDVDTSAAFDGSATVRVPSSATLNPTTALTLEAWVKPASNTGSETVVRKDRQYMLRLVDGTVVFRTWTSAGLLELASAPVLRTGSYQHLMAVFYGTGMRIYRNGSLIASREAEGQLSATDSALHLGSSSGGYDFFTGSLDEVAIYASALSSGADKDHYLAGKPRVGESYLGCGFGGFRVGAWPDGCWRPYSATSPFNRPLPSEPRVVVDSDRVVARLLEFGRVQDLEAGLTDTDGDYGHPTYYSQPGDPLFRLHCYEASWGTCPIEGHEIRVPDAARPAAGRDAHLTIVDQDRGWEYDLYKVRSKPLGGGVLEFRWGGRTRIDGDGLRSAATAAKFGNLAGIVRVEELAAGRIGHALFLVVSCDAGRVVYPATGRGRSCASLGLPTEDAPPMGARFQLAMTPEEINALPLPAWKKTILHAMATYGMFVGDTGSGSWAIKMESGSTFTSFGFPDPLLALAQANGWTPWDGTWVGNLRDGVDWRRLRLIEPCVTERAC